MTYSTDARRHLAGKSEPDNKKKNRDKRDKTPPRAAAVAPEPEQERLREHDAGAGSGSSAVPGGEGGGWLLAPLALGASLVSGLVAPLAGLRSPVRACAPCRGAASHYDHA